MASATAGDVLIEEFVSHMARRFIGPNWSVRRGASLEGVMSVAFHLGRMGKPCHTEGAFGPASVAAHEAGRRFGDALFLAGTLQEAGTKAAAAAQALPVASPFRADALAGAHAMHCAARAALAEARGYADQALAGTGG